MGVMIVVLVVRIVRIASEFFFFFFVLCEMRCWGDAVGVVEPGPGGEGGGRGVWGTRVDENEMGDEEMSYGWLMRDDRNCWNVKGLKGAKNVSG